MGEGKWVVFVHRGAGSTEVAVWALLRRPPVEGGRQTIFHVSVATATGGRRSSANETATYCRPRSTMHEDHPFTLTHNVAYHGPWTVSESRKRCTSCV